MLLPLLAPMLLGACGTLSRLSDIGRPPEMSSITDPTRDPAWRPVTMPMPAAQPAPVEANSLWRSGSRAFFKDQRAAQVGDIVTVLVNIADTADWKNASAANRNMDKTTGIPALFGLSNYLPKGVDPSKLLSINSTGSADGTGSISGTRRSLSGLRRSTQVLPNGNLVVAARQEVRVNSELANCRSAA